MRLLLFLSALLAALSGAAGSARVAVGVERSAALAATPVRAVAIPRVMPVSADPRPPRAAVSSATLPRWTIARATPRWVERLRV